MTEVGQDVVTGKVYVRCPHDLSRMHQLNTKKTNPRIDYKKFTITHDVTETYQCESEQHRITIDLGKQVTDLAATNHKPPLNQANPPKEQQ